MILHKYKTANKRVVNKENYKAQLLVDNVCDDQWNFISQMTYSLSDFKTFAIMQNTCRNSDYMMYEGVKIGNKFRVSLKLHTTQTKLQVTGIAGVPNNTTAAVNPVYYDFDTISRIGIGVELELKIPVSDNNWSFVVAPYLLSIKKSAVNTHSRSNGNNGSIRYRSLNFPIGVRYYPFTENAPELYLDGLANIGFTGNSELQIERAENVPVHETLGFKVGIGYRIKWLQLQIDFEPNRNMFINEPRVHNNKYVWSIQLGISSKVLQKNTLPVE